MTVVIYSYVDDVSPLILTRGSTQKEHNRAVNLVKNVLIREAGEDNLQ